MTFSKFEEIFRAKYPDGKVFGHGRYCDTRKNGKTTVIFHPNGEYYSYYGAYEDILSRIGINVISKERLAEAELTLEHLIEQNGKESFFGWVINNDTEIEKYKKQIETYLEDYIIV